MTLRAGRFQITVHVSGVGVQWFVGLASGLEAALGSVLPCQPWRARHDMASGNFVEPDIE